MLKDKKMFIGSCVSLNGNACSEMVENAKPITYETLTSQIYGGRQQLNEMFGTVPHISKDWSVGFYSSKYNGVKCVYVQHSAIEYVFTDGGRESK